MAVHLHAGNIAMASFDQLWTALEAQALDLMEWVTSRSTFVTVQMQLAVISAGGFVCIGPFPSGMRAWQVLQLTHPL